MSTDSIQKITHKEVNNETMNIVEPSIDYKFPMKMNATFMTGVIGRVSEDLFLPSKFKHWDNVVIAGGYVIDLLYGTNYCNDIDLFIYNTDTDNIKKIAETIINLLNKPQTTYESKAVRTVHSNGRTIQIINGNSYSDLNEVLESFDLNCCKVAFDGYNLVIHPLALTELKSRTIHYDNITNYYVGTDQRLYKYITKKGFGLTVDKSHYKSMYPLYLFTESRGFEYIQRMYTLHKYPKLLSDYKNLVIRLNPIVMSKSIQNKDQSNVIDGDEYLPILKSKSGKNNSKLMAGNSLSCCVSTVRTNLEPTNQFGLPLILYRIKIGDTPPIEELYQSISTDMCGFHVTCYLIFYHPSEQFVIDFVKESHLLSSKNINNYGLSYLELACLLNRLKLAKFFMTKETYRIAMSIARIEDNVELYQLAYKSYCSDDRYFYKREDLIQYNSANLLRSLYDDEMPQRQKFVAQSKVNDQIQQMIDKCHTPDDFLLTYNDMQIPKNDLILWLKQHSTVELDSIDVIYENVEIYAQMRNLLHKYYNRHTNDKCRQYYSLLTQKLVPKISTHALSNPETLQKLLQIKKQKYLDPTYKFTNLLINLLIIYLDDTDIINQSIHSLEILQFLKTEKNYLGPNFLALYNDLNQKDDYISTYKVDLQNNNYHDHAYANNVLSSEYERTENAIGYTPDDIILWRTIMFYVNLINDTSIKIDWYDPMIIERRKSVKNIDLTKPCKLYPKYQ